MILFAILVLLTMLYSEYLKQLTACPFCGSQQSLSQNESAYLTFAYAPYHKHHLLVVPKRHTTSFFDITHEERVATDSLIELGTSVLRKLGYENFTILVREGSGPAKSIPHMHYHIIPDVLIGDLDHRGKERTMMTDAEMLETQRELASAVSSLA